MKFHFFLQNKVFHTLHIFVIYIVLNVLHKLYHILEFIVMESFTSSLIAWSMTMMLPTCVLWKKMSLTLSWKPVLCQKNWWSIDESKNLEHTDKLIKILFRVLQILYNVFSLKVRCHVKFYKKSYRKGFDYAIANTACFVKKDESGIIERASFCVGGIGDRSMKLQIFSTWLLEKYAMFFHPSICQNVDMTKFIT